MLKKWISQHKYIKVLEADNKRLKVERNIAEQAVADWRALCEEISDPAALALNRTLRAKANENEYANLAKRGGAEVQRLEGELELALGRNVQLREVLKEYGKHDRDCCSESSSAGIEISEEVLLRLCDCGLVSALEEIK